MKKRPWYYFLTYAYTWPWDLIIWLLILFIWLLWGTKLYWQDGLWCVLKPESWPKRTWYKKWAGTTFGHGGFLSTEKYRVKFHENIHVEQYEVAMLQYFLLGFIFLIATKCWILSGCIWLSGSWFPYTTSALQAKLRGEALYRGNIFEESAYAQTDLLRKN